MPAGELRLELFHPGYYTALSSWFADQGQLTQWGGPLVRFPLDALQLQAMLPEPPRRLSWMATGDGEPVGHTQLISLDRAAGVARLGRIVIAPAHRGQRLAIPMLELVLGEAFSIPEIERVDLGVYTWNAAAIRTYARLGFASGEVRQASVRIEAQDWDLQEMSLTREAHLGASSFVRAQ